MNSTISQVNTNVTSKFKSALISKIEEKVNIEIQNFNFKSQENVFINTFDQKEFRNLNGFTILTILDRFFYTEPNSKVTYISNVVVDKSETISFSLWKSKVSLFWKTEFSFEELEKLCYEWKWFNRKIILVWIYDWKLTKLESQVTSERTILLYLKNSDNENTVDISTTERKYKENTVNVLSLTRSKKQISLSQDEENEYYSDLSEHINSTNSNLFSKQDLVQNIPSYDEQNILWWQESLENEMLNEPPEEWLTPITTIHDENQLTFDFSTLEENKPISEISQEQPSNINS